MADTKTAPPPSVEEIKGTQAPRIHSAQETIDKIEERLAAAREILEDRMLEAHVAGLSYSALAEISGFSKQHAGHLVTNARDREDG